MAINYISSGNKPKNNAKYTQPKYSDAYKGQLNTALKGVTQYKYDPLQDANYQALAKIYNQRGEMAARNTIGDNAALNGGYGTSYGVSAAMQARNQYNQELAMAVPDLMESDYNRKVQSLAALREADNTSYDRYRDKVADTQWQYNNQYQKYRDAMSDYQWAKGYNVDVYSAKKSNARSGRSGGASGGSKGYSGSGSGSSYVNTQVTSPLDANPYKLTYGDAKKKTDSKK